MLSGFFYVFHYIFFKNTASIYNNLLLQLSFLPLSVFLVTVIVSQLLTMRDKHAKLYKLNMVIGAFFSEVGMKLLKIFSESESSSGDIRNDLMTISDWPGQKFISMSEVLKKHDYDIQIKKIDLEKLREFLILKRNFLLRLLENPNLLEHETFTKLLWAVFHFSEELECRTDIKQLPETDLEHLAGDIKRVYSLLIVHWISYMKHLQEDYPYLFSLAVRTNPFNPGASPEVK
jgi:hypothetical protein